MLQPASLTRAAKLRRMLVRGAFWLVVAALLLYALDYSLFRVRAATKWNAYGSVTVSHYDAIAQKSGKTQFVFDPPGPQVCVNALFPHAGFKPCWYLKRHPEQRTDI